MQDMGCGLHMGPALVFLTCIFILPSRCLSTGYPPPGGMMRVMESSKCPPGTEMLVTGPSSSSSSRSELWGGFWSVLFSVIWLSQSSCGPSLASEPCCIGDPLGGMGVVGLAGAPVSISSSLSSSIMASESCWIMPLLTMETLLVLPPSDAGGGASGSGLLQILDPSPGAEPLCSCSSSWTCSSYDSEEE